MNSIVRDIYNKLNRNYQHQYLLNISFSYLKQCKKILDIGCGDGEFLQLAPKKITGIDTNRESVTLCKKKGLHAAFGSATRLPYKDHSFDGVHASHVLEHLYPDDAYTMLKEVGRILKRDGVFVLSTPLLWEGFFEDFTHIKPYYPSAVLRYLVHAPSQPTMERYPYRFEKVALYYRYRPIWLPTKLGKLLSNYLYTLHVHTWSKDAYTLVLKKIS